MPLVTCQITGAYIGFGLCFFDHIAGLCDSHNLSLWPSNSKKILTNQEAILARDWDSAILYSVELTSTKQYPRLAKRDRLSIN